MNSYNFLKRLHVFIAFFIGPFIFIAALSGAIYAFSFAAENWVYRDILTVVKSDTPKSLALQIEAANKKINNQGELFSIRPAPTENQSTRVLYLDNSLKESQYRTIFVDPYTLEVKADMITYGQGGAMPARMWIDIFHRDLIMGAMGRWYSELAASWMWLTGITGLILFASRRKKIGNSYQRLLNKHTALGLFALFALFMLSITGLTWSKWAGENISKLRTQMSWQTPGLQTKIGDRTLKEYNLKVFDEVLKVARNSGINSDYVEIKPPRKNNESWQVSEIYRGYPTQVDAVSIDSDKLNVLDKVEFRKFPLMAKFTRWGIDFHMGTLFGFFNQLLIGVMSLAICALVFTGYKMWIKSHGWKFKNTLYKEFKKLSLISKFTLMCILLPIAFFVPLIFISLVVCIPLEEGLSRLRT